MVSNNCTDGVREQYTAKPQKCPGKAPRGLRIVTADGKLTAEQGHNVTLMVQLEEVGPDPQPLHLLEPLIFSRQSYLLYVCFCCVYFFFFSILNAGDIFNFFLLLVPWFVAVALTRS